MFQQFLDWWLFRLGEVLAFGNRRQKSAKQEPQIRVIDANLNCIYQHERNKASDETVSLADLLKDKNQQSAVSKSKSINLCIAPSLYLLRQKILPLSIGRDTRSIMEHDLKLNAGIDASDRDNVLTGWNRTTATRTDSEADVCLFVVKRNVFDEIEATLRAAGLRLNRLLVDIKGQYIDLLPTLSHPKFETTRRFNETAKAVVSLGIVLGIVGTVFHILSKQQAAISELNTHIAEVTVEAGKAQAKLRTRREQIEKVKALREAKLEKTSFQEALRILTKAIPDDAWLTELHLRNNEYRVVGLAQSAADLINPLESLEAIEEASFSSNIIKSTRRNAEQFSIRIQLSNQGETE